MPALKPDDLVVFKYEDQGVATLEDGIYVLEDKLTAGSNGALDEADYRRTVQTLLSAGSEPVITKEPEGAWTSMITDKALK